MPNEIVGKMTLKKKIKACYKILFKSKPIASITYGLRVVRCVDCEYNLKCDGCAYKALAEKDGTDMPKCQHIENDPKTVDPCIYEEIEVHKNVTVRVNKCKNCGHIEYRWERQPDTISEYEED